MLECVSQVLYERLSQVAEAENRSIAQQTVESLKKAPGFNEEQIGRHMRVLEDIGSRKVTEVDAFCDSVAVFERTATGF